MEYKIKILKDTPFDKADTYLSLADFRLKYSYLASKDVKDEDIIAYLNKEAELNGLIPIINSSSLWFEVVRVNNFVEGDWVFSEKLKKALHVVADIDIFTSKFLPNSVSLNAANSYLDTYKRHATESEILDERLYKINDRLLLGKNKCYYYQLSWQEIVYPRSVINSYEKLIALANDPLPTINWVKSKDYIYKPSIILGGIKVGCVELTHDMVLLAIDISKGKISAEF